MKQIQLLLLIALISGCVSYGETTRSDFAPLKTVECISKEDQLFLFMDNEKVDFPYEKIGMLEVQGGQYSSLTEVMDELKYKAWSNCANGIINVAQSATVRESGTTFVDDSEDLYASKVFTGISVRIPIDDAFRSTYQNNAVEMDFVSSVEKRKMKESKRADTEVTASVLTGVLGLIIVLIVAI